MSKIHVVGLGPGNPGHITLETLEILKNSDKNYFRTTIHPVMGFIKEQGVVFESFDAFYEEELSFEGVYVKIVEKLIKSAKEQGSIVYAVPGNPMFGEETVVKLLEQCKVETIDCKVYPGVSFVDVSMNALEVDPIKGLKIIDAFEVDKNPPEVGIGNLITQVYNHHMASELKLRLMDIYDSEKTVILLINSGIPQKAIIREISLWELDRVSEINHLTSLYIPKEDKNFCGFEGTKAIIETLRSSDGCPWDRAQTHETLRKYLIEECNEVVEAIDNQDWDNLCEELGDVLFQVIFHAQIGNEMNRFTMEDVLKGINDKMVRRHPHVFMDKALFDPEKVETNWEAIKEKEKSFCKEK
ncbi:MAG: MazG family protein [Eubacteriaceae bacterium]